ncbi:MAG: hypothetical protein JWR15_2317 [Prosthecobacter sp.]|nr:hypothetical protein [Prosthecobacter sp.]
MSADESAPTSISSAEYLAAELERLMALPLTTPEEVEQWYDDCGTVQQTLERQFPTFMPEHEFWHFCSDADIRSREVGYRDRQHLLMSEYVHRLRTSTADA